MTRGGAFLVNPEALGSNRSTAIHQVFSQSLILGSYMERELGVHFYEMLECGLFAKDSKVMQ